MSEDTTYQGPVTRHIKLDDGVWGGAMHGLGGTFSDTGSDIKGIGTGIWHGATSLWHKAF